MGRPPAKWVVDLAQSKEEGSTYVNYHELSKRYGITLRAVTIFCSKAKVEGEYYKAENNKVRKRFTIDQLRNAEKRYVEQLSGE